MNSQPHLQPASETSGLKTPHGRVVAKIVCAMTGVRPHLVRHLSAIRSIPCFAISFCPFPSGKGERWEMVSFDSDYSDGDGALPSFFKVSLFSPPRSLSSSRLDTVRWGKGDLERTFVDLG